MEKTKVIFRKWRSGGKDVIAMFPEVPATNDGHHCQSYEHVGQHGGACPQVVINLTMLATPDEYKELKAELENIGYVFEVRKRFPPNSIEKRLDKLMNI